MGNKYSFLKTTIIGGLLFLVPIVVILIILGKAFDIMSRVAEPLSAIVPIDMLGGIAIVNILALLLIVFICFGAGIAARSNRATTFVRYIENNFLSQIPTYAFVKGMTQSFEEGEKGNNMKAVLAKLDDNYQIAFEIERIAGGHVAVYLPGAPNPWSGSVCIFTEDRIQAIDATMATAVNNLRHLGKGSDALLGEILKRNALSN